MTDSKVPLRSCRLTLMFFSITTCRRYSHLSIWHVKVNQILRFRSSSSSLICSMRVSTSLLVCYLLDFFVFFWVMSWELSISLFEYDDTWLGVSISILFSVLLFFLWCLIYPWGSIEALRSLISFLIFSLWSQWEYWCLALLLTLVDILSLIETVLLSLAGVLLNGLNWMFSFFFSSSASLIL